MTPRAQNGDESPIPKDGNWHHVEIQKGCLMPTRVLVDGVEQLPTAEEVEAETKAMGWITMDEIRFKRDMPVPTRTFEAPTTMRWRK